MIDNNDSRALNSEDYSNEPSTSSSFNSIDPDQESHPDHRPETGAPLISLEYIGFVEDYLRHIKWFYESQQRNGAPNNSSVNRLSQVIDDEIIFISTYKSAKTIVVELKERQAK
ncbi:uncharacterized protein LOC123263238 [Cotesia glomerata]|nr:uncharacterized protein LOC123263238 [Cotesia glomerata]